MLGSGVVVPAVGFEVDVDVFVAAVLIEGSLEEVVLAGVNTLPAGVGAGRKEFGEDVMFSLSFFSSVQIPKCVSKVDITLRGGMDRVQAWEDEVG